MDISGAKSNYIILSNNIINGKNIGTNLYIKTNIINLNNNNNYDISWQNIFQNLNTNYKNRIFLSGTIHNSLLGVATSNSCCLITKNNIKNNVKFIYDSSTNINGKIAFVKNLDIGDNSLNYLFNDLSNTFFENNKSNNIDNSFNTIYNNRYIYHLNYYFSKSDIYKINSRDYLYKYANELSNNLVISNTISKDISYNKIGYIINNIVNDFSFINTTIDSSSVINFNINDYRTLLIDNNNNNTNNNNNNISKLETNVNYSIYRNMLSYNKLTLDYKHVNYYDISLSNNFNLNNTNSKDISYINLHNSVIKTFLIRTNNFRTLPNIKRNSKIIFNLKNIYLNNVKVLDKNSNFYFSQININGQPKTLTDVSNTMFIALGNQLTGITQHDIYNHVHLVYNSNQKLIIKIKKNINTININTNSKFASLIPRLNNYYLLDIPLNYTNNNNNNIISHNINNTIQFNNALYSNIDVNVGKVFNLDFNSYFNALTNNYFKSSFNNLAALNNINNNIYSISAELVNSAINVKFKNIIKVPDTTKLLNRKELLEGIFPQKFDNGYDLRYNYNEYFYIYNELDLLLLLNAFKVNNNYFLDYYGYGYGLLNFYSLTINNLVKTSGASDFTNVDCIYIYHDPVNDPDERFRYPNNNIEIKFDTEIDTLSKAIEQYRGSGRSTSTTNAAFVPAQNGSNLSRKMIQGIIGLNNIPKLLSIEPYDPNFINGRGFANQYQITDNCIESNCDKLAVKQNAIKHDSVKNNKLFASNSLKKQNFVNIVKSSVRNKLSQECISKIQSANPPAINIPCNNSTYVKKTTPFVLFAKGKGKYLGP